MTPLNETQQAKMVRKEEAKKLKRQRILDAGGTRPRKKRPDENDDNNHDGNKRPYDNTKKHKKQKQKQKQANNQTISKFGKVMINTPCPNKPRTSTLSIAIPGSIVSNAQTMELRTYLVGQIARACTIYHVDEIVVFDDNLSHELKVRTGYGHGYNRGAHPRKRHDGHGKDSNNDTQQDNEIDKKNTDNEDDNQKDGQKQELKPSTDPHTFMANILQYCECPQYLRRHFFPMHPDLQFAGLLNPLDAPHHVRVLDKCPFRDGVVTDKRGKTDNGGEGNSLVDCGIRGKLVEIDRILTPNIRCTVMIDMAGYNAPGKKIMKGKVVSPSAPRERDGTYWGYSVRMASSIKSIFDEAPYNGGYDLKIGTSERGNLSVDDSQFQTSLEAKSLTTSKTSTASFQHAIIVFGGVAGIEECVDADETIGLSGSDSSSLFDLWVNICEYQGSRTIRTEEAVLIGLSRLCPHLFPIHNDHNLLKENEETYSIPKTTKCAIEFSDDDPSDEDSATEE